ncbi:MAG TPA: hypothetical protein VM240_06685 [Verrucomicrobiae bacterium]|nr:hypothetical protein [Verrucomicrobiae bacterium]
MAVVSAGTYYGLELLPPGTIPEPIGRSVAAIPSPAATAPAAPAIETATAPAQEPAAAPPAAEPAVTEQDLAEEPMPEESPAPPTPAQVAAAEPEPARVEPAAAEPAPAAPAPRPARARALQDVVEAPAPKKPKVAPPEADVIKPWWPVSSQMPANQLKLQYAGQVQGEQAIALLFSAPLKLATVQANTKVKTLNGDEVKGSWELGKNPRLAVFRGVGSGRYTVILQPQVADTQGFMLGTTLQGPVYIQAP